jgi:hypothetical protein
LFPGAGGPEVSSVPLQGSREDILYVKEIGALKISEINTTHLLKNCESDLETVLYIYIAL